MTARELFKEKLPFFTEYITFIVQDSMALAVTYPRARDRDGIMDQALKLKVAWHRILDLIEDETLDAPLTITTRDPMIACPDCGTWPHRLCPPCPSIEADYE